MDTVTPRGSSLAPGPSPVVFLPGLLNTARVWAIVIARLGSKAAPWVADLTRDASIEGLAARVLDEAPFPRFSLAGLSMGGYVAFEVMRRAPERIERLALIDTQARPDTPEAITRRRALIDLSGRGLFRGVAERLMPLLIDVRNARRAELSDVIRGMAAEVGRQAFIGQQTAIMHRPDSRPMLAGIACPTLVLCGANDMLTPRDRHEEIAAAVPGARLVVLADCGHMSPIECPEAVATALAEWLAIPARHQGAPG